MPVATDQTTDSATRLSDNDIFLANRTDGYYHINTGRTELEGGQGSNPPMIRSSRLQAHDPESLSGSFPHETFSTTSDTRQGLLCRGTTVKGKPCKNKAKDYCHHHTPLGWSEGSQSRNSVVRSGLSSREAMTMSPYSSRPGLCHGTTLKGEPCKNKAADYCHHHRK